MAHWIGLVETKKKMYNLIGLCGIVFELWGKMYPKNHYLFDGWLKLEPKLWHCVRTRFLKVIICKVNVLKTFFSLFM